MAIGNDNLEGKLRGVAVGDMIMLYGKIGNAGGFVVNYNAKIIKLSHEDPLNNSPSNFAAHFRISMGRGDREYLLRGFDRYEVIRKSSQEEIIFNK